MARSYDFKSYLQYIKNGTTYTTNTYVRAVVTETSYTTTSSTFSYTVYLGVDSGFYHYQYNNFVTVSWGGTVIKGSSSTNYGTINAGTCKGTSSSPACNQHGSSGSALANQVTLYTGTVTIDSKTSDSYAKTFSVSFKQAYGNPDGSGTYYTYTATASKGIPGTIIRGAFDSATTYKTTGWAYVPYVSDSKLVMYGKIYNSSGTLLKTYTVPITDNRQDVVDAHGSAAPLKCGYNYSWDLVKDLGRQVLTVKMYASYDGGAQFQIGSSKTVDTRTAVTVYDGSAWQGGDAYVYNGSSWVKAKRVYVYNGSSWV